jgi:uncharacterized protein
MSTEARGMVRDNAEKQRFELETSAGLAVADYRREGDALVMYHTEVPVSVRGQGWGEKLVRGALTEVQRRNLRIIPRCWSVREVMEGDPQCRDMIA